MLIDANSKYVNTQKLYSEIIEYINKQKTKELKNAARIDILRILKATIALKHIMNEQP